MPKKLLFLLSTVLLSSGPCRGNSFVIPDGTTVTTTQILANPGDTGFVEYGGEINCAALTNGGTAVLMDNINQQVLNQGTIIVTDPNQGNLSCIFDDNINGRITNDGIISMIDNGGGFDIGISIQNTSDVVIINNGSLSVLDNGGGDDIGIYNFTSPNALIVNNGNITIENAVANADGNYGIYTEISSNSVVINNGTITTINISGAYDRALFNLNATSVLISNTGKIFSINKGGAAHSNCIFNGNSTSTTIANSGKLSLIDRGGGASHAIHNQTSTNTKITNSGVILLQDDVGAGNDIGIFNDASANTTLVNSGIISVNGTLTDYAILNTGANINIVNSGVIYGSGAAIFSNAANPNLTLLVGSNLQGGVHFATDPVNLSVQSGLNLALTLDATSVGFGALNISAPFVLDPDPVIAVIDPTGLAMQADMTADFSDALLGGLYLHHTCATACQPYVWGEVLGNYRTRAAQSQTLPYTDWLAGCLIGYDLPLKNKTFCLFTGYSYGQAQIQASPQQADISLGCLGAAYEGCLGGTCFGFAALGAYVHWNNHRTVMNNLAPGGMDGAHVDMSGGFFTTEAKLARALPIFCCDPFLSFTLRYAALFLGTYTESGSLTNLSVQNRTVGLLTTRLETTFCSKRYFGFLEPFVGIYGRYQVQGTEVQGVLLAQDLSFAQGGPLNLVAGILGLRGIQSSGKIKKYFSFEVDFDNADSTRALGELGISF